MLNYKRILSDKDIRGNLHGTLLGTFLGMVGNFIKPRRCYLLRNKRGDLFVLQACTRNNGIYAGDRVTCDQVDLVHNIDVPAKVWDNLRVKEVLRKL